MLGVQFQIKIKVFASPFDIMRYDNSGNLSQWSKRRGIMVAMRAHIPTIVGWSHTRGIYLYVFRFISALSCRVPCPDGIKLQSLGNVRFRNWRKELGNDYRNDQL